MRHFFRCQAKIPAKFRFESNILQTYKAYLPDLTYFPRLGIRSFTLVALYLKSAGSKSLLSLFK